MLNPITKLFTPNKSNKLPSFSVALIMLPFSMAGLLMASIIELWGELWNESLGIISPSSLFFTVTLGVMVIIFLAVWCVIFFFITAAICRFTDNTILNYALLGISWLLIYAFFSDFVLISMLTEFGTSIYIAMWLLVGLVATISIELNLKNKLPNNEKSDLLDDSFLK